MLMILVGLAGCGAPGNGPRPLNDLDGDFFDAPWPSDLRRSSAGGLDMSGFPNVEDYPLLADYAAAIEERVGGAGNNAPIYLRFQGPLDTSLLPSPEASIDEGSPLVLVDIDPSSPERGSRVPVQWRFTTEATAYQPENLLAVSPLFGFPLRPSTTYALFLTLDLARQDPELAAAWLPDDPNKAYYSPLQDTLFELGIPVEDVAIATIFTTGDPISELRDFAAATRALGVADLDQVLHAQTDLPGSSWVAYGGRIYLPLWQHGEKPYDTEGGSFMRDEDGQPLMYDWELTDFTLALPRSGAMPEGGWPVVLYSHGTGGSDETCCDDGDPLEPAEVLSQAGFAVLGISQPLHGDRGTPDTDPVWHSFNYLNLDSALYTFRQSALDLIYVAHQLAGGQSFELDGQRVVLNPEEVFFMGHSQGGITGAMAAPFFEGDVRAAVFSGAGGGLSLSLAYRAEPALGEETAGELVSGVLGFDEDEVLDELHPVAGLVQTLGEVTDPLNLSPLWFRSPATAAAAPLHVLMTEGMNDRDTPPLSTEALAAAASVPLLAPAANEPPAFTLRGLGPQALPTSANAAGFDGSGVTAGLAQYPDDDHFAVFTNPEAAALYQSFFASALRDGAPTLGR